MAKQKAVRIGLDWLKICCRQDPNCPLWDELKEGRNHFGSNGELFIFNISKSSLRIDAIVGTLNEYGAYTMLADLTVYPSSADSGVSSDQYGKAFLRLHNEWLYDSEGIGYLMGAIDSLHLEFNNITRMDIALTSIHVNFSRYILAAIRDTSLKMVYRGREWQKDDATAIDGVGVMQNVCRRGKIRNSDTLYCGMAKDSDVRLRTYNKDFELFVSDDDDKRSTINRWLGLSDDNKCAIYRLEVELKNDDLNERLIALLKCKDDYKENVDCQFLKTGGILWKIMDDDFLLCLLDDSLHRILRFRKGNKQFSLFDICKLADAKQLYSESPALPPLIINIPPSLRKNGIVY